MVIHRRFSDHRRGATLVLICILMTVLVAMVAFAVDVGRMYLVRSQLQSAVDSGALAAGLQLREDSDDVDAAMAAAEEFVQLNRVGWLATVPEDAIVVTAGTWDSDTRTFTAGGDDPKAVQVSANLDDEPLFFSSVLGHTKFSVPRSAIVSAGGLPMDIIMTLDLSGSMGSQGRIQALQTAAPTFVDVIEEVGDDDRIGVFGYGALVGEYDPTAQGDTGTLYVSTPQDLYPDDDEDWVGVLEATLTSDFDDLRNNVLDADTLTADKYNGWTPIGAALRDSAHYLQANVRQDEEVQKVIVLMSDGHANKPAGDGPGYALEMADYAASLGIKVYTISLGAEADEDLMEQIAERAGGKHFDATTQGNQVADLTAALTAAFKHVASDIKRTQLVQ